MATDPWVMAVWPKVIHPLTPLSSAEGPRFAHKSTRVTENGEMRSGDTFWVADIDGQAVGLAWHWLELFPGVVVHADPNGVYTNLRLVDPASQANLDELQQIVAVNTWVHALPWQAAVMDQIGRQRVARSAARSTSTAAAMDERLLLQAA